MLREIFSQRNRECLISVVAGEIASVRRADHLRTGLRVYEAGRVAVAGGLGEVDLEALEAEALEALESGVEYPEPTEKGTASLEVSADLVDHAELLSEVEEVLKQLRGDFPELIFSHQVGVSQGVTKLVSEEGLDLHFDGSDLAWGLLFKQRGSANIIDGMVGYQGRRYRREDFLAHARELCGAFLNPVDLPRVGRLPVVFSGGDGLSMPLSFFARALEGRVFGSGSSPLSGVRGSRVYSPDFTLQQTRHPEDTTGAFFDGEGRFHEGYRLSLIEAGVVRTPFTDRRTAALYDLPHTGAGSGPYDGVPSLGTPRLRPLPGEKCLAECLGGDPGILVSLAAGGEFTPEGKYATPVQLAFLHDGEKIMGKLPEVVIQGSDRDMFGPGFRGVTAETWPRLSGEHLMVLEMDVARG